MPLGSGPEVLCQVSCIARPRGAGREPRQSWSARTHRNADKGGYRWYNDYRLPDHLGGGVATVRLHGDASDTARKFNRTENVRPIPPDDPSFRGLFRRRNDAESINRALEDTLWLRRAHSLGHRRQVLNLLGYALIINSLAVARHRQPADIAA